MKEQKANYIMHTYKQIFGNTLYYYNDDEIIAHLKSDETLTDIYQAFLGKSLAAISSIVLPAKENGKLELHIIVKHEQKQEIGQWEYFFAPTFPTKSNLQRLVHSLQISTGISSEKIFSGIMKQVTEWVYS